MRPRKREEAKPAGGSEPAHIEAAPPPPPPAAPAPPPIGGARPGSSIDPPGGVGGGDGGDPDGVMAGAALVPVQPPATRTRQPGEKFPGLFGSTLVWNNFKTPQGVMYPNFKIKCVRNHPDCWKTCGLTPRNTRVFGNVEPLLFLHDWLDYEGTNGKKHTLQNPPAERVAAFERTHGAEIRALYERIGISL